MIVSHEDRFDSLFVTYSAWDRTPDGHWVMREPGVLDWRLLKKQAQAESSLNPRAVSPVGAKGLFQFMDATWNEWSDRKHPERQLDPFNCEHATFLAAAYLEWLLGRFGGDVRKALAAYNWGLGNVGKAVSARGDDWEAALPDETAHYLAKILA